MRGRAVIVTDMEILKGVALGLGIGSLPFLAGLVYAVRWELRQRRLDGGRRELERGGS
jgi:hypothetical protein